MLTLPIRSVPRTLALQGAIAIALLLHQYRVPAHVLAIKGVPNRHASG